MKRGKRINKPVTKAISAANNTPAAAISLALFAKSQYWGDTISMTISRTVLNASDIQTIDITIIIKTNSTGVKLSQIDNPKIKIVQMA